MKSKSTTTPTRGRPPKQKAMVKQEIDSDGMENIDVLAATGFQSQQNARPSVEIMSCISYQKFRYSGENRPGKKYQEKDFMELKLTNLGDKVVRIVIICTDADNKELIHPNGLVGKDCHDGIYDKEYAITKPSYDVKIPYLRTERIKTKKNEHVKIRNILKSRAQHLPSPYRERCESQCTDQYTFNRKFDTTKVCLGVIVTVRSHFQGAVNGSLHAISHVVNNASEKTALGILKLSNHLFSPSKGGKVDVFTTEDGPAIEYDKYLLYVTYENEDGVAWESEKFSPGKEDILYKRIITYSLPPFHYNPTITQTVKAILHLDCPQSNQSCVYFIYYALQGEDLGIFEDSKRSFAEELDDIKPPKRMRFSVSDRQNSDVKEVLKQSLKKKEDDRRNSLPPDVQIIHTSDDGALVRRTESHSIPEALDQNASVVYSPDHSSHPPNEQNESEFQNLRVLAAAYSNSVPSDTVLIITNDGPEDIENAIHKGVSYFEKPSNERENDQQMIFIDRQNDADQATTESSSPSENQKGIVVPASNKSSEIEDKTTEQSAKIFRFQEAQILSHLQNSKVSQSVIKSKSIIPVSKKTHKTDSPWAVASDDENEEAMNIFKDLSFHLPKNIENKSIKRRHDKVDNSDKNVHIERQKTISILSNTEGLKANFITKQVENFHKTSYGDDDLKFDCSEVALPNDNYINSEVISNFELVKEVGASFHS